MHLRNSFISTTRCDDLARATEAQDGKNHQSATTVRESQPTSVLDVICGIDVLPTGRIMPAKNAL